MNAGVREALKENDFHCFVFHDVDLIPEGKPNYEPVLRSPLLFHSRRLSSEQQLSSDDHR